MPMSIVKSENKRGKIGIEHTHPEDIKKALMM